MNEIKLFHGAFQRRVIVATALVQ